MVEWIKLQMTDTLNSAAFEPHLRTSFHLATGATDPIVLELIEVQDASLPQVEQFSLMFQGPKAPCLAQGIHELEHAALGKLALFLVPVGPDPARTGLCYQAIFNRLKR